jgi:hypothetical protein
VHVSTSTVHDFNTLTPVIWKFGADDVCVSTSRCKNE